jgi:hypothetical protein
MHMARVMHAWCLAARDGVSVVGSHHGVHPGPILKSGITTSEDTAATSDLASQNEVAVIPQF